MSRPRRNEGWNRLFEVAASTHRISQFDIPDDSDVSVRNEAVNGRDPSDGTFQPEDSRRRRSDRRIAAETPEPPLPPARILRCVGRPRCTAPHRGAEPRCQPSRPRSVRPSGSDCQPGNRGTPRGSRPTPHATKASRLDSQFATGPTGMGEFVALSRDRPRAKDANERSPRASTSANKCHPTNWVAHAA